jgi:hypothetical protein
MCRAPGLALPPQAMSLSRRAPAFFFRLAFDLGMGDRSLGNAEIRTRRSLTRFAGCGSPFTKA